jgi:hypothetical protein
MISGDEQSPGRVRYFSVFIWPNQFLGFSSEPSLRAHIAKMVDPFPLRECIRCLQAQNFGQSAFAQQHQSTSLRAFWDLALSPKSVQSVSSPKRAASGDLKKSAKFRGL